MSDLTGKDVARARLLAAAQGTTPSELLGTGEELQFGAGITDFLRDLADESKAVALALLALARERGDDPVETLRTAFLTLDRAEAAGEQ